MDLEQNARHLVERLDVLRCPSDLDLLIFFARHPSTLLSTEQIAAFLGYDTKRIAASIDLFLGAGLLTRTPHRRHATRWYVFAVPGPDGGWLDELMRIGVTREGRLALIRAIRGRTAAPLEGADDTDRTGAGPGRPFRRRRAPGGSASRAGARRTRRSGGGPT